MAATPIKHSGEVIRVEKDIVYVRMSVDSACSGCHARMVCGVDESKDKIVEVATPMAHHYQVGDNVEVALQQKSMGAISVLLAYVAPFFILTILLVVAVAVGASEAVAAAMALAGVAIYYVVLWLLQGKVKNTIVFIITKQTK